MRLIGEGSRILGMMGDAIFILGDAVYGETRLHGGPCGLSFYLKQLGGLIAEDEGLEWNASVVLGIAVERRNGPTL